MPQRSGNTPGRQDIGYSRRYPAHNPRPGRGSRHRSMLRHGDALPVSRSVPADPTASSVAPVISRKQEAVRRHRGLQPPHLLPGYSLGLEQADAATLAGRHAYAQRRARGLGFRLSQRGALRGSMGQAASDGVDGDAFVRGIGTAGPVEGRHARAACVVQTDQSPFVVENRAAGAAALGR